MWRWSRAIARAQAMATEFGFLVIEDTRNESETAAIEMATAWCEQQGYDTTIVVPGDIPLITGDELHRVLDAAPAEGAVFVPAYDRRGSNCILRRPASIIPLRFGNDSFLPHCEAMKQTGKELVILEMPGIGLDIDNPHELELLVQREGDTQRATTAAVVGFRPAQAGRLGSGGVMKRDRASLLIQLRRVSRDPGARNSRRVSEGDSVADLIVDALALGGLRFTTATSWWSSTRSFPRPKDRKVALDSVKPSAAARRFATRIRRRCARGGIGNARGQASGAQEAHSDHRDAAWLGLRQQRS